jgi:DHA1 family tetracycline resistance protein-like MFS transporter
VSHETARDVSGLLPENGLKVPPVPDGVESAVAAPGRLTRLLVVAFAATAAFAGFEATFSLLGQRRFGLTEGSVTPVFFAIGIGLVIVQGGVVGRVADRLGPNRTLQAALVLNAAGLAVLAAAYTWLVLAIALSLLVVGQGLATPTLTTVVAGRAPEDQRGHALGRQQSAGALARIVGPIVAGLLFQHVSIAAPYLVGAALLGVALALLVTERVPAATQVALSD